MITRKGNILLRSVDELIDQDTGLWDVDLMQDSLNPIDVSRIQRIPLSLHLQEDFVAWHFTKNHVFSVRSAYYAEWNHLNGRKLCRADEQGTSSCNPVWEILWKLQVPSKVKKFIWRALLGIVPGKAILSNRHIPVSDNVPSVLLMQKISATSYLLAREQRKFGHRWVLIILLI